LKNDVKLALLFTFNLLVRQPVIIATCIALPVGYWAMNKWLQNFAYKTTLSWWGFILAALITFGIALTTVCVKAIKVAIANPVKSLRTE
jgi:putative ABC transport system permease protein